MRKKIELHKNNAGGIDLITERDSGNLVRILTGKPEHSIQYWKAMKATAEQALQLLEGPAMIHVVIVKSNGYGQRRSYKAKG